MTYLIKKISDG